MVTLFLLTVALAVAPQQREPVAPETAAHVACILAGADEEQCTAESRAAIRALAALSEAEAVGAVRTLLAAPLPERTGYGGGGRLSASCDWDHEIGLPVAEDYDTDRFWLEDGPPGARCVRQIEHSFGREPCVIGCMLIQGWGEGAALVPELCALLRRTDRSSVGTEAARALGARRHPSAIPVLVAAVGGHASSCAIVALSKIGPGADPSVFALLRSSRNHIEASVLWYVARHAARVPGDVLAEVPPRLAGEHHREALTALVQAGMRSEGLFLRELARSRAAEEPVATERALAGLILLPGRSGPAFPTLLAIARDPDAAPKIRALAMRYVAESPAGVALLSELIRLAETPGDVVVRTAAARALGRLPAARLTARDAALVIAASDVPDNVCIAALRSAVDCDASAAMRTRLVLLARDRNVRQVLRTEAGSLVSHTAWRA